MDTDDIAPPPKKLVTANFDLMGIDELEAHIASLQAEIERARAAIALKQKKRGEAEKYFSH